jgi:hypothetical protein
VVLNDGFKTKTLLIAKSLPGAWRYNPCRVAPVCAMTLCSSFIKTLGEFFLIPERTAIGQGQFATPGQVPPHGRPPMGDHPAQE